MMTKIDLDGLVRLFMKFSVSCSTMECMGNSNRSSNQPCQLSPSCKTKASSMPTCFPHNIFTSPPYFPSYV